MKKIVLKLLKLYKKTSFLQNGIAKTLFMSDAVCRFTPTCSEYTYQAIEKYGIMKGGFMGFRRILSCHPWSKGGFHPVH